MAKILSSLALYLELAGENSFKVRAFQNAAHLIEHSPLDVTSLAQQNRLRELKGIGASLEAIIKEILATQTCLELEKLKQELPASLFELLALPGLGPKKARVLWQELGITTVEALQHACQENLVAQLPGFGSKTQQKLLEAISFYQQNANLFLYPQAQALAMAMQSKLFNTGLFQKIEIAGSLRRGKEIVKDADILVIPYQEAGAAQVAEAITALADKNESQAEVSGKGPTKISLRYQGLPTDFRIIPPPSFACAYQYFTGSKEHNTQLRSLAKKLGFKVNEYALIKSGEELYPQTEEELYQLLGLAFIPPELREGDGEIEAAAQHSLPELITAPQLKGLFHVHTTYSDGAMTLEELVQACLERGYQFLGISDHSVSAYYASGLSVERLQEQAAEIKDLNAKYAPFKIFHGIEADILPDGSLDYPPEVLAELDFVIGSIHSKLNMTREEATQRLVKAITNKWLTILGHPSGRLLLTRPGYEYDTQAILEALQANQTILEHNCHPARFDADWRLLKRAGQLGCLIVLSPDLHSAEGFAHFDLGLTMARKAWLKASSVINTWTVEELNAYFTERKTRALS